MLRAAARAPYKEGQLFNQAKRIVTPLRLFVVKSALPPFPAQTDLMKMVKVTVYMQRWWSENKAYRVMGWL